MIQAHLVVLTAPSTPLSGAYNASRNMAKPLKLAQLAEKREGSFLGSNGACCSGQQTGAASWPFFNWFIDIQQKHSTKPEVLENE